MGPDLYFVRIIVTFEGWTEGLKQDVELDGAPTDGEEQDNDRHHAGYFSAHNLRALRQKLYLEERQKSSVETPEIYTINDLIENLSSFMVLQCIQWLTVQTSRPTMDTTQNDHCYRKC